MGCNLARNSQSGNTAIIGSGCRADKPEEGEVSGRIGSRCHAHSVVADGKALRIIGEW